MPLVMALDGMEKDKPFFSNQSMLATVNRQCSIHFRRGSEGAKFSLKEIQVHETEVR